MTFREKLAKEHPDKIGKHNWGGCRGCPGSYWSEYNHLLVGRCVCSASPGNCTKCWNQEIPETSTNGTIKENDEMKNLMSAEDRINAANEEIKDLKKEIARLEKYKQYDDAAQQTKAIYDSYIAHGFTEAQAWNLLCIMVKGAFENLPRR